MMTFPLELAGRQLRAEERTPDATTAQFPDLLSNLDEGDRLKVDQEWTVERHLLGKPPEVVALYHRFIELAQACGPFTYSVSKSAITLKGTRRGFAGASLGKRALSGYLDLPRRVEDPRITRSSPYTKRLWVHHFRVDSPSHLDQQFAGWLGEAYRVGAGAHLDPPKTG